VARPLSSELVGRQQELESLSTRLSLALSGRGQVAVLRGEAGIGKTRLVDEIRALATARGASARVAEAREPEQTRPFGAASDALGVSLGAPDPVLAQLARDIYTRPELREELPIVPVEEHYLVERLVAVFEVLCNASPLFLAIDNLHWADGSTMLLIGRLAELSSQYPVLLLLTTRPTDRPEVEALLSRAGSRGAAMVELGPLDTSAVSALASQVVGGPPGQRLQAQLARAGGNPLLVVELACAMVEAGSIYLERGGIAEFRKESAPATLDAAVLHLLNTLPEATVQLLRRAALLGPVVNLEELAAWTGESLLEMAGHLRAAGRSGLVGTEGGELVFRHVLVQDALYHEWPAPVRKALHREVGRALAATGALSYRVAYHLAAAADVEDQEAAAWLHRAGVEVASRSPLEGARLLGRAVELAPKGDGSLDAVRADLAVAMIWGGEVEDGERLARAVVAETASAEVRGKAAWWLSSSLLSRYRGHEAKQICSQALQAGVAPDAARVLLQLSEATAAMMSGALAGGALGIMGALVADAERLGDRRLRSYCLTGLAMAEAYEGRLEQAVTHGAEAVREVELLSPAEVAMAPAYIGYAWALEEQDRLDEAIAALERRERIAGPLPLSSGGALSATLRGRIHWAAGRWDDALADLGPVGEWQFSEGWADMLVLRALIALHRDQREKAREDLVRVDEVLAAGGSCSCMDYVVSARAFLLESEGQPEKALEQLRWLWQVAEAIPFATAKPKIGPQLARLSVQLGEPGIAEEVVAGLEKLSATNPGSARLAGAAAWCRGLADQNIAALLEAVELYQRSGRPLELGLVCEDTAAIVAARGSVDKARTLLEEALEHYDDLFAAERMAWARARLRALGVRVGTRGRRRRPTSGWDALTEAEQRVAGLVAEHLSNPEIADRLFISRRTVETHVSNALAKLSCVSRRELVAVVLSRKRRPRSSQSVSLTDVPRNRKLQYGSDELLRDGEAGSAAPA
jgi:DNA-binding CsgD family transcriptional regulator